MLLIFISFINLKVHFYFIGVSRKFRCGQKDSTDFKYLKIGAIKYWMILLSIQFFRSLLCIRFVATIMDFHLSSANIHVNWLSLRFQENSKSTELKIHSLTNGLHDQGTYLVNFGSSNTVSWDSSVLIFPPYAANGASFICYLLRYKLVGSAKNPNFRKELVERNVWFLRQ